MNYKVGDKVVVRYWEAMARGKELNGFKSIILSGGLFSYGMIQFCGDIANIIRVFDDHYTLDIDDGAYIWTDEMFRPYFAYGEEIEVKDGGVWKKYIFVGYIDGCTSPIKTVWHADREKFRMGGMFATSSFACARPLQKPTKEEVQKALDTLEKAGKIKDGKVIL